MHFGSLRVLTLLGALSLAACPPKAKAPAAPPDSGVAAPQAGAMPESGDIPPPADVKAPPADAEKTASGLATKVLKATTSTVPSPDPQDTVTVHYTGWRAEDGKMFDSSVKRGQPASFGVKGVIPGFGEGLRLMKIGEKRRLWIPENLAYKGMPGGPQGMLVFEVELIDIRRGPKPLPAPEDVAAPPADAQKTKSGIAYKILTPNPKGKKPAGATDIVEVHYTGWTTDGNMFDSSVLRGAPVKFPLDKVIPGWTEGVQLLRQGEKGRLWIPEELAYKGRPGAPQGMLVFDIELLSFQAGPKPPPVPKDVKAPPKNAKKTASGLAYKVLKKGKGKVHPTADSTVEVNYSGWTTDGKMFDSSVTRGQPAVFTLRGVIPGWTEGLQLLVEGEQARLWIPEALAYKGAPGAPQGMLVFDVELLSIR
ncbi:MAG: FKBP-type peptidyl-prolyl cis-trans isomerase [Deltaproteobacteria bacterium]|nr:FKBP-type peptidyl-prolyl cis-trans isomerase [Deltaproteobacteria bacterium]